MITLDKTWLVETIVGDLSYGYLNYPGKHMVDLKNVLVASGWNVAYSSDKISVSASDLWIDYTKVFWASPDAHSWCVLENTDFDSTFQFVIDTNYSNNAFVSFEMCPSGYNTDGTITTRPTPKGPVFNWELSYTTPSTIYCLSNVIKVFRSSDNQCFRVIWTNGGLHGDGVNIFGAYRGQALLFERPKSPVSWWPNPIIGARFSYEYHGMSYVRMTTSGQGNMRTIINGTVVNILLGTIGATDWPTRSGVFGFGAAYDGKMSMPPMYWMSDNATYPGVLGIMYDAYPASPYHLTGTRYPTTTNSRGLLKLGSLAIGCPYGPMVV